MVNFQSKLQRKSISKPTFSLTCSFSSPADAKDKKKKVQAEADPLHLADHVSPVPTCQKSVALSLFAHETGPNEQSLACSGARRPGELAANAKNKIKTLAAISSIVNHERRLSAGV